MRNFWFAGLVLILPFFGQAQSLSPQVVGNAGGTFQKDGIRVNWTLGEAAVSRWTAASGAGSLTEGFHQPLLQVKPVSGSADLVNIAPNPVESILNLYVSGKNQTELAATLSDAQGRVLLQRVRLVPGNTEMDLSSFPSGMYFLTVQQADSAIRQTYKVVKMQ